MAIIEDKNQTAANVHNFFPMLAAKCYDGV